MLIELTQLGLIAISGVHSEAFLQGQLGCDVKEVTAHQSRLGVHCNAKGRVLASFRLFYVAPTYYLLLPQAMIPLLIRDLKKYAVFYNIKLEATEDFFYKIGFSGYDIEHILGLYGCSIPMKENEVYRQQRDVILNIPGTQPRVILLTQKPMASTKKAFDDWQQLDIESGLASIYPETRALFTPHQLYYHQRQGISFTKGCYTGQEVIARMHYLGALKHKLYHISIYQDAPPQAGHVIVDEEGQKQGTLIMTTATSKTNQPYQGLASIYNNAIGKALYIDKAVISIVKAV